MKELTDRQKQIYQYIKRTVQDKGYPPSVREIGNAVGLQSSSTVHGHLAKQEENSQYASVIQVPVLGKVTAGLPITAVENVDEYFPLPEHFTANHNSEIFLLNVAGDSMIEAGIHDGDRVIVRKQNIAHNGDII